MSYKVTIIPSGQTFFVKPSQTILEAAISEGINIPYGCQNGMCGACKCKIDKGIVIIDDYQETVLSDPEKEEGWTLCCKAYATEDLIIEAEVEVIDEVYTSKVVSVRIHSLTKLSQDIIKMLIKLPGNETLKFKAGQYIEFILPDGKKRAFSMANRPGEDLIELHLRLIEGGEFTNFVFNEMKEKSIHEIDGPIGQFFLRESKKPIIFIAGGTGFAPIKSIIEDMIINKIKRPIFLYRGAKFFDGLYMHDLCVGWAQSMSKFNYIPVLENKLKKTDSFREGLVHKAALQDISDLENVQIYCCGAPGLVETAFNEFISKGLPEEEFFADAFTFEPRKT